MNIAIEQLGFVGILQAILIGVFLLVGIALLFFQRSIGTTFVLIVLGLFVVVGASVAYSGYSFMISIGEEASVGLDPTKVETIRQGILRESAVYWKMAAVNLANLAILASIAGVRGYLWKKDSVT